MTERRRLTVVGEEGVQAVEAAIATEPPWLLSVRFRDGAVVDAEANDLFAALESVRTRLERRGLLICCQGARPDVFPSGMSRQMSGGRRAYRLVAGHTPTRRDLVDIFDRADCGEVVTVEEQQQTVRRIRGR